MHSSIYLCIKNDTNYKCRKFKTFIEAHDFYFEHFCGSAENTLVIPVCSYMPEFLQQQVLQYKIKQRTN